MVSGIPSSAAQIYQQLNVDMNTLNQAGNSMSPSQISSLVTKIQTEMQDISGPSAQSQYGNLNATSNMSYGMPNPTSAYGNSYPTMSGSYYGGPGATQGGSMAGQINQTIGLFNNAQNMMQGGGFMPPYYPGGGMPPPGGGMYPGGMPPPGGGMYPGGMPPPGGGMYPGGNMPYFPGSGSGMPQPGGGFGGNAGVMSNMPPMPTMSPGESPQAYQTAMQAWQQQCVAQQMSNLQNSVEEASKIMSTQSQIMQSIIQNM